jgi:hypothetical protein
MSSHFAAQVLYHDCIRMHGTAMMQSPELCSIAPRWTGFRGPCVMFGGPPLLEVFGHHPLMDGFVKHQKKRNQKLDQCLVPFVNSGLERIPIKIFLVLAPPSFLCLKK